MRHAQRHAEEVDDEIVDLLGASRGHILASARPGKASRTSSRLSSNEFRTPPATRTPPLQALIFDSVFNSFRGIIAYLQDSERSHRAGEKVRFINTQKEYQAEEIGVLKMDMIARKELRTGDVGYIVSGIKNATEVKVGDTITSQARPAQKAIEGFQEVSPWSCRVYPSRLKTTRTCAPVWRNFASTTRP
jgi:GTP-binding protein LepA